MKKKHIKIDEKLYSTVAATSRENFSKINQSGRLWVFKTELRLRWLKPWLISGCGAVSGGPSKFSLISLPRFLPCSFYTECLFSEATPRQEQLVVRSSNGMVELALVVGWLAGHYQTDLFTGLRLINFRLRRVLRRTRVVSKLKVFYGNFILTFIILGMMDPSSKYGTAAVNSINRSDY